MRKRTEALTTWLLKLFRQSVQNVFLYILEYKNLFQILG